MSRSPRSQNICRHYEEDTRRAKAVHQKEQTVHATSRAHPQTPRLREERHVFEPKPNRSHSERRLPTDAIGNTQKTGLLNRKVGRNDRLVSPASPRQAVRVRSAGGAHGIHRGKSVPVLDTAQFKNGIDNPRARLDTSPAASHRQDSSPRGGLQTRRDVSIDPLHYATSSGAFRSHSTPMYQDARCVQHDYDARLNRDLSPFCARKDPSPRSARRDLSPRGAHGDVSRLGASRDMQRFDTVGNIPLTAWHMGSRSVRDTSANLTFRTPEDLDRSSTRVNQSSKPAWNQDDFAGLQSAQRTRSIANGGKLTFYGAPHVQDSPDMMDLVCGSKDLLGYYEEHESKSTAKNILAGLAGKSDQDDDLGDVKKTGRKYFGTAPHVADKSFINELICGSDRFYSPREKQKKAMPDTSNMFQGYAGASLLDDEHGSLKRRTKRHFWGAPHVQDTPMTGILIGSEHMERFTREHEAKGADLSNIFDGMAGRCLQDEDQEEADTKGRSGKKSFAGAPHVADTPDLVDLVCGSQAMKESWAARANSELHRMFDGCAGISAQDEDVGSSKSTGRRRPPSSHPATRSELWDTLTDVSYKSEPNSWTKRSLPLQPLPTLFISHGLGPMPLMMDPRQPSIRCLSDLPEGLGIDLDTVRCLLFISAHWETHGSLEVSMHDGRQRLLYDFQDAPPDVQNLDARCHPPGDLDVSRWAIGHLKEANFQVRHRRGRKLDHGVFVPLILMRSLTNFPVVQVSLPALQGRKGSDMAQYCLEMGQALEPLRLKGVLIIGSGMSTNSCASPAHNERWTRHLKRLCCEAHPQERYQGLMHWTSTLPHAREVHGREEHLLPLHVALGAATAEPGQILGDFRENGYAMTHFRFG
eukprot:TRINITY_DN24285_c0_g1_i1.p1 TRINITY_DN24285_c0_g1~~TRINITY_DN24285_c0_g1_i1.p1  ORF type:complete len:868 (-),score=93.14 TRINITY_DN24285_c0_g1_i1:145-2748(-)